MNTNRVCGIAFLVISFCMLPLFLLRSEAKTGIMNTRHNLSVSGPGEIRALTETRVCVFCHTPHNAAPNSPLWNRSLEPVNYILYSSTSLGARPTQPGGPSRLCLSCHDGLIALGKVLRPAEGIALTGELTTSRPSYIGTNLTDDHPVSFSYYDSLPNHELAPAPPSELVFYGNGNVHCTTCHDAHDDTFGKFLVMDNRYSALCTKCHIMEGWLLSSHRNSMSIWSGLLPNPWPRTPWSTVAENGCENCHTPHAAGGPQRILYYLEEEKNCYVCHNGHVASKNIEAQFRKFSRHPVERSTIGLTGSYHDPKEKPTLIGGHVECVDCHNPHGTNARTATAPGYASGSLDKVSGVDITAAPMNPVTYEYEVCFKCHADTANPSPYIPRMVNTTNTRFEFDTTNPSYHPVVGQGKSLDIPSIPSVFMPTLTAASIIYCTDCHDSNESSAVGGSGPKGPHGSSFPPILRERYETNDNTPESYASYALCYRCHNRDSILRNDSFSRHSLHLSARVNAPCSACHDPHGIKDDFISGDHRHLMNFDTRIVFPVTPGTGVPSTTVPIYQSLGFRAGSCTLVCHGRTHVNQRYP